MEVHGVVYTPGDGKLSVSGTTWTLKIPIAESLNLSGPDNAVYEVKASVVAASGATKLDATSAELTVFRDVTMIDAYGAAYVPNTRPTVIGRGGVGAGEYLVVNVYDSNNKLVVSFSSQDGKVILDAEKGSWQVPQSAWGTTQLAAGNYTAQALVMVADGSGGQSSDLLDFTVYPPDPVATVANTNIDDAGPRLYMLNNGGYMLAWAESTSFYSAATTLYAQRYNQDGTKNGGRIILSDQIGTNGYGYNDYVQYVIQYDIVVQSDNSFMLLVESYNGLNLNIASYDASGNRVWYQTKNTGGYYELDPSWYIMDDGRMGAVWASGAGLNYNVWQQKFNANGSDASGASAITSGINLNQGFAYFLGAYLGQPAGMQGFQYDTPGLDSVYLGGVNSAMVYMSSTGNTVANGIRTDIYLRVYDYDNNGFGGAGTEIKANTFTQAYQIAPSAIRLKEGGFLVTWVSNHTAGSVNGTMDDFNVYARRFDFDKTTGVITPIDAQEVMVNKTTSGVNGTGFGAMIENYDVAALQQGGYVVVWGKMTSMTAGDIYSMTFDAAGNQIGGETLVSTDSDAFMDLTPTVTALMDGGYTVAWVRETGSYSNNRDGNIWSVTVNADGTIRGEGDNTAYPTQASYINNAGAQVGNASVNTLDGRNGGTSFAAGDGNDRIIINHTSFSSLDGGGGVDMLIWDSAADLDLSVISGKTTNIEDIHLGDKYANTLTLALDDVLAMAPAKEALMIEGGEGDKVDLDLGADAWMYLGTQVYHGMYYQVYAHSDSLTASVWVEQGLSVI